MHLNIFHVYIINWIVLINRVSSYFIIKFIYVPSYNFQTNKNASPIFLFAEPRKRSQTWWTTSPILLTNNITSSCNTSVASVKFLISQNPKMQHFFLPGSIGSTSPLFDILDAIISLPASPNPKANNVPILIIAFSMRIASYLPESYSLTNFSSVA